MEFIADLHLHSKYSRATSQRMDLENLQKWAQIKGIKVSGTADFTHPQWFQELKEKLMPAEPGLFKIRNSDNGTRFLLSSEISCIYSKKGQVRKIHTLIFAPGFKTVEKINAHLGWIGNLKSDGRPILGLDAKELVKIVLNMNKDCLIVPAHCLLSDTFVHTNPSIEKIKNVLIGDRILTHQGRFKKVKEVYKRPYKGKIINIKPYYFRIGLKTTPEHPLYGIKSRKYCPTNGCKTICKPTCSSTKRKKCPHQHFKTYKPQWIQAKDVEKGDILIFPRFNEEVRDKKEIKLNDFLTKKEYQLKGDKTLAYGNRAKELPNIIEINKEFCRLLGYYMSEGYTDSRDSISFCFNEREKNYVKEVKDLMKKIFGLSYCRQYMRKNAQSIELIFFSKILSLVFSKLLYNDPKVKRAHTKCLPFWVLKLPPEKQAEVLKGWWRGDTGYTSSRYLMNQMKIICLRLGTIPSIGMLYNKEDFNEGAHKIGKRTISAQHDHFQFSNLSFLEDEYDLLSNPCFEKFKTKLVRRHGWMDEKYIYIPVRDIEITSYEGEVYNLEVEDDNSYVSEFATVHNCWTPWFSLFGSRSGFNSIEECFEDYSKYIFAGETGLSSDPAMNWRLSALDKIALISNSDSHSPENLGREANVFNTELSYQGIIDAIKSKDPQKFLYTIEFYPEEGKYHYDGHRNCDISFSPKETKKYNGICPVCGKPLTIGVLSRVEDLSDRPEGFVPENSIPYKSLVPLREVIAEALGVENTTKQVQAEYNNLVESIGSEFNVLLKSTKEDLEKITFPEVAEGILRAREGKVFIEPGYDGVYGKVRIFSKGEKKEASRQKTLF